MQNRFLLLICVVVISLGVFVVDFPNGAVAIGLTFALSAIAILLFRRFTSEKEFVTTVFLVALAVRMAFGLFIHIFDLRDFFGGDALAYDWHGSALADVWRGGEAMTGIHAFQYDPASGAGWGMYYLTAAIYYVFGRNVFAAQSFCAVIGAATAPMVFFLTKKVFNNLSSARIAAIGVAIFPSFVIWSGQLLKDGLITFLLVLAITMVLQLQAKFGYAALGLLIASLFGILTLRFYIFYMALIAVVGSFVVGMSTTTRSILRSTIALALLAFALLYLGVGRSAEVEYRVFGSLERVQSSRSDLARAAGSGYLEEADVSTTEGAISAMPLGFAYLMFAPFPWQASNLRQAITIPEVLIWWAMIPFVIVGLVYAIRHRLRNTFPILIFSLLLTLAYSIFQGNVGTAYRQRTQIQVFLFVLMGVGWTVYKESRENEKIVRNAAQRAADRRLQARV